MGLNKKKTQFMKLRKTMKAQSPKKKEKRRNNNNNNNNNNKNNNNKRKKKRISIRSEDMQQGSRSEDM